MGGRGLGLKEAFPGSKRVGCGKRKLGSPHIGGSQRKSESQNFLRATGQRPGAGAGQSQGGADLRDDENGHDVVPFLGALQGDDCLPQDSLDLTVIVGHGPGEADTGPSRSSSLARGSPSPPPPCSVRDMAQATESRGQVPGWEQGGPHEGCHLGRAPPGSCLPSQEGYSLCVGFQMLEELPASQQLDVGKHLPVAGGPEETLQGLQAGPRGTWSVQRRRVRAPSRGLLSCVPPLSSGPGGAAPFQLCPGIPASAGFGPLGPCSPDCEPLAGARVHPFLGSQHLALGLGPTRAFHGCMEGWPGARGCGAGPRGRVRGLTCRG